MLGAFILADKSRNNNTESVPRDRYQIHALYNNFKPDALFVKSSGLNGVCHEWCTVGPKFPDPKPYGVNYPGGTFKFALTDNDGTTLGAAGAQMYRTGYFSLQTPYLMFGLGRISNYIQTIFYGTNSKKNWFNYWQGVIPNSQVIAIPYKVNKPTSWSIELFLSPSAIVFWIIILLVVTLIILAAIVIGFKLKERVKKKHEYIIINLFNCSYSFGIVFYRRKIRRLEKMIGICLTLMHFKGERGKKYSN